MRLCCVAVACALWAFPVRADDVYEFVASCKAAPLAACLNRIETSLDRLKGREQGTAFCLPRMLYPAPVPITGYPVSMLDYLLLRLSAARIGRAGHPYETVMRDVLSEMYPCRQARG
jgi:hypothetical protein